MTLRSWWEVKVQALTAVCVCYEQDDEYYLMLGTYSGDIKLIDVQHWEVSILLLGIEGFFFRSMFYTVADDLFIAWILLGVSRCGVHTQTNSRIVVYVCGVGGIYMCVQSYLHMCSCIWGVRVHACVRTCVCPCACVSACVCVCV